MKNQLIGLFLIAIMLVSCKPAKEITNTNTNNTVNNAAIVRIDSVYIYQHDSIIIRQKGDTVFVTKFKTLYKDSKSIHVDSIYTSNVAYINKTITLTKTVKSPPEKVQVYGLFWWIGLIGVIGGFVWGVWKLRKYVV